MRSVGAYCKGVAEKDPLVSRCEAMPKAGPSPLEWKKHLLEGSMLSQLVKSQGKGQGEGKPASAKDPFGKPLVCKCGISTKVSKTCR